MPLRERNTRHPRPLILVVSQRILPSMTKTFILQTVVKGFHTRSIARSKCLRVSREICNLGSRSLMHQSWCRISAGPRIFIQTLEQIGVKAPEYVRFQEVGNSGTAADDAACGRRHQPPQPNPTCQDRGIQTSAFERLLLWPCETTVLCWRRYS